MCSLVTLIRLLTLLAETPTVRPAPSGSNNYLSKEKHHDRFAYP